MKNIIFDIGNVLLAFQPEEYLKQFYTQSQIGDLMMIIFSSEEWDQLDLGTITIQETIDSLTLKHSHYHEEITFILKTWTKMMTPIQKNVDIAYQLKEKGYTLYLLSNFHNEAIAEMFDKYDFFNIFEGHVISAHVHTMKPNIGIYHILMDKYQLNFQDCVFIDDSFANINTANSLGMTGIHLPYLKNLEDELKAIHVL